jgi:non-heme Fe2+,alpha-ketoglutarate-dependent halogenase
MAINASASAILGNAAPAIAPIAPEADTRDLRFHPVDTTRPLRRLTASQRDAYNQLGYIAPLPVFTPAQATANLAAFDRLLAMFRDSGKDSYAINGYHTTCASIHDIVTNPVITDYVEDLLGSDVVAWGSHYFCKMPNDGKAVSWHQDAPYWPMDVSRTVTVWLAIDDVDEGNAAMQIIPGSHAHGALPRRASRPEEGNILWETVDGRVEDLGRPVSLNLRAGEVSLHSDLMVHGSVANPGPRRRCGLTIRYAPVTVRSKDGWNDNAIIVRGSDAGRHWRHHARPHGDSPFGTHKVIAAN